MIKIETVNGTARIFTPYNAEFVKKIKNVGGRKWDSSQNCWTVPETEIDTVRDYMMEVFGESDLPDEDGKITIKVTFNDDASKLTAPVTLYGKEIARAWGRDSGAKIGDDVTLISGRITSGGSQKNWRTVIDAGSVFKIRDVPKKALKIPTNYDVTVEEVEEPTINREALKEEKAKLLARIAEIDSLLAQNEDG